MKSFQIPEPYKNREEWEEAIRKDERRRMKARAGEARWAGKTKEEKSEHGKMMARARKEKLSTGNLD